MKVSIIIPVYNVSAYIERCIKSVMNQTSQDIECVLVDDSTPDDSIAIAKRLIANYNGPIQFRIIHHEHNKGLSAARNTGINAATGDYIYFLDSDDEITPDCIEKLARPILNDPTIEMVMGGYADISIDSDNKLSERLVSKPEIELTSHKDVRNYFFSKQNSIVFAWNRLTSRDFILKNQLYFKEGINWEDILWQFFYYKHLSHLYILPNITYKYCRQPNSITKKAIKDKVFRANGFGLVFAEIAQNLTSGEELQEVLHYIRSFCLFYLDVPTSPTYKLVSNKFLQVLKDNHRIKEWLLLKSTILLSRSSFTRWLSQKVGVFLKIIKKTKVKLHF